MARPKQSTGFEYEVLPAREVAPVRAGLHLCIGPPGSGKSTLLGSMHEEGPALVIATLQREASSWLYQKHNLDTILIEDEGWDPMPPDDGGRPRGSYEATAFLKFKELIDHLIADEICAVVDGKEVPYRVVLIDSGTKLADHGWHEALSNYGVMDPAYMEFDDNRFGPYTALDGLLTGLLSKLGQLKSCKNPKLVGIAWHVQPAKEDQEVRKKGEGGGYTTKESSDNRGRDVEYLGDYLPMIRGAFRRKLFAEVDTVVWTHIEHETQPRKRGVMETRPRYMLQVVTDEERHCKLPGPVPDVKYIDNSWSALKKLMSKGVK